LRIRIIAGFALLLLLPILLFFAASWMLPIAIGIISAAAVQELLGATHFAIKKRIVFYALVFSCSIPVWYFFEISDWLPAERAQIAVAGLFCFTILLFIEGIIDHKNITFGIISTVLFTSLIVPVFFSSLVRISETTYGHRHYILLPFAAAIAADTCAYFTGIFFGKRKLKPDISPKKTVEGAIGGLAGGVVVMILYGLIQQFVFHNQVNYPFMALYGVLGSAAAQIGDLSMSLIKREFGVKDFGTLIPGHGGILDRFDSLLFTAPLFEGLLIFLPALTISS